MAVAQKVYLGIKGDVVVHHTDLDAMKKMDGITKPDMTITEEEFEAVGGLVRLIDGKIFLGKTDAEKKAEETAEKVAEYRKNLADTDYIAYKLAEVSGDTDSYNALKKEYAEVLKNRKTWRDFIGKNA